MWLPYNGNPNQIWVDHENLMKHTVTNIEGVNDPVAFNNNIIGNYFVKSLY